MAEFGNIMPASDGWRVKYTNVVNARDNLIVPVIAWYGHSVSDLANTVITEFIPVLAPGNVGNGNSPVGLDCFSFLRELEEDRQAVFVMTTLGPNDRDSEPETPPPPDPVPDPRPPVKPPIPVDPRRPDKTAK